MQADLLIRVETVHDGTGASPSVADVAVRGRHITLVGEAPTVRAARVIDADGLVVSPGFIDIHIHTDLSLMLDGRGQRTVGGRVLRAS